MFLVPIFLFVIGEIHFLSTAVIFKVCYYLYMLFHRHGHEDPHLVIILICLFFDETGVKMIASLQSTGCWILLKLLFYDMGFVDSWLTHIMNWIISDSQISEFSGVMSGLYSSFWCRLIALCLALLWLTLGWLLSDF